MKKPEQNPSHKRWFRGLALALPILLLLGLEGVLHLANFGYSPHFFLKSKVNGENVWIENQEFTKRFFPPKLARSPQPTVVSVAKPTDTTRIFIFGESAAMGDPEPAFGFGRVLQALLAARYPERTFEVVNVSVTAINSHVVREIAKDCAPMQGDVWIIYMGNNEVVGPYGAGTVFGAQTPNLAFIRTSLALKSTRLGQLVERVRLALGWGSQTPASWEGMEMFLKQQVPHSDVRLQKVYAHFSKNLSSILFQARKAGAKVLLCTVASNLKDCAPFASQGGPGDAAAQFQAGRTFLAAGQTNEARASFARARDFDTLRFRADSEINAIIRKSAGADCQLVDLAESFGIAGEELFFEHVHFNFEGNYAVGRRLAEEIGAPANSPWLTRDECAQRLAYTEWDEFQIVDEMVKRLELPPFTNQIGHEERLAGLRERRAKLETKLKAESHDRWVQTYSEALKAAPGDWVLHENFARVLQFIGDARGAEREWRRVTELLPHSASAWYSLGNVLDGEGKSAEAMSSFQRALQLNPNAVEARNGMGLTLAAMGRGAEAREQYERALRTKPDFAEARVNLGLALAQQGRFDAAIREYQMALQQNSNSVAAHLNLGKALLLRGDTNRAVGHYREAVRLKPDDAIARFNLGNALAGQGNAEGLTHLAEAARLNPGFAEAHYNLGLELAKVNRYDEAVLHLEKAVQLKPNTADAHFNLGVAYAKQKRFGEAIVAFESALRLNPENGLARKYLDQARTLQAKGL